jgi:hypothetical protein
MHPDNSTRLFAGIVMVEFKVGMEPGAQVAALSQRSRLAAQCAHEEAAAPAQRLSV